MICLQEKSRGQYPGERPGQGKERRLAITYLHFSSMDVGDKRSPIPALLAGSSLALVLPNEQTLINTLLINKIEEYN
jgi:hypothetical protein